MDKTTDIIKVFPYFGGTIDMKTITEQLYTNSFKYSGIGSYCHSGLAGEIRGTTDKRVWITSGSCVINGYCINIIKEFEVTTKALQIEQGKQLYIKLNVANNRLEKIESTGANKWMNRGVSVCYDKDYEQCKSNSLLIATTNSSKELIDERVKSPIGCFTQSFDSNVTNFINIESDLATIQHKKLKIQGLNDGNSLSALIDFTEPNKLSLYSDYILLEASPSTSTSNGIIDIKAKDNINISTEYDISSLVEDKMTLKSSNLVFRSSNDTLGTLKLAAYGLKEVSFTDSGSNGSNILNYTISDGTKIGGDKGIHIGKYTGSELTFDQGISLSPNNANNSRYDIGINTQYGDIGIKKGDNCYIKLFDNSNMKDVIIKNGASRIDIQPIRIEMTFNETGGNRLSIDRDDGINLSGTTKIISTKGQLILDNDSVRIISSNSNQSLKIDNSDIYIGGNNDSSKIRVQGKPTGERQSIKEFNLIDTLDTLYNSTETWTYTDGTEQIEYKWYITKNRKENPTVVEATCPYFKCKIDDDKKIVGYDIIPKVIREHNFEDDDIAVFVTPKCDISVKQAYVEENTSKTQSRLYIHTDGKEPGYKAELSITIKAFKL